MDGVSGIADKSNEFGSFLTVARKFNFTCVYVFHTMYPSKLHWQMIISQTKIFNIFPGSFQISSIARILSANCRTINCRKFSSIGPSKYRTRAESDTRQICYYNRNKKDKIFNKFLDIRKQGTGEDIIFEIKNIFEETNNGQISYYELNNELNEFNMAQIMVTDEILK